MENCCRTCLKETQIDSMKYLSTKWNNTSLSFADMLMDIVEVNKPISSDSEESLKICASCESDLITAYNFKIVCLNTEKILSDQHNSIISTIILLPSVEEIKCEPSVIEEECLQIHEKYIKFDRDDDIWEESFVDQTLPKKSRGRPPKTNSKPIKTSRRIKSTNKKITVKHKKDNETLTDTDTVADDDPSNKKRIRKPTVKHKKDNATLTDTDTGADDPSNMKQKRKPRVFCRKCDIKFETETYYMRHCRELHWETSLCTMCGKVVPKCTFEQHMVTHTNQRNFICTICDAKFLHDKNLKEHMRIHTGEKRYKCNYCDETFVHWNSKKNHMYQVHTKEKKYKCYICQKQFGQNGDMKSHVRHHTGDFPYRCEYCHKGFSTPSKLKRHMVTHKNLSDPQTNLELNKEL